MNGPPGVAPVPPPRDEHELRVRAFGLVGHSIASLAVPPRDARCRPLGAASKGKVGELVERALGATGGSRAAHDFPELGVELKTLPVDARGVARESTYVCRASFEAVETLAWERSWVRAKLAHVLWVPVVTPDQGRALERAPHRRRRSSGSRAPRTSRSSPTTSPRSPAPSPIAGVDAVSARRGKLLQLRPKAASGSRARAAPPARSGDESSSVPRGFYLRATFTTALLARARIALTNAHPDP